MSEDVEINTVDGYQGREKDVVILTTVRSERSGVGFLSDTRRMNVALTRARTGLYVVGDEKTLLINPHWKALIDQAKASSSFLSVSTPLTNKELLKTISNRRKHIKQVNREPAAQIKFIEHAIQPGRTNPKPPPMKMKDVIKKFQDKKNAKPEVPVAQIQFIKNATEAPANFKVPLEKVDIDLEEGEVLEESEGEEEVLFLGSVHPKKKPKLEENENVVVILD